MLEILTLEFPKERLLEFKISFQEGNFNEKFNNLIFSPCLIILIPLDTIQGGIFDIARILRFLKLEKINDLILDDIVNNISYIENYIQDFFENLYDQFLERLE
jgi:hypothetical protein